MIHIAHWVGRNINMLLPFSVLMLGPFAFYCQDSLAHPEHYKEH